ncbi:hypothetical protein LXL04_035399 [Taraxacum kok-saghyz]
MVETAKVTNDYSQGGRGYRGGEGRLGGGGDSGGGSTWRFRKLDMPLFDGINPDGWILKAERYFSFYRLYESDKLEAAVVALEGDPLLWFQWEDKRYPVKRWKELKGLILRQFRRMGAGTLYEQWLDLSQNGSVSDYVRSFIELLAPLNNLPDDITMGQFVNGLQTEIRAEVRLVGPQIVDHTMSLALKVEEKIRSQPSRKLPSSQWGNTQKQTSTPSMITPLKTTFSFQTSTNPSTKPHTGNQFTGRTNSFGGEIRRLTDKELQAKRDKGLCYRCDDKWSVGHHCKRKELSVLLIQEEEDGGEETPAEEKPEPPLPPSRSC